jgi:hypothetical protein
MINNLTFQGLLHCRAVFSIVTRQKFSPERNIKNYGYKIGNKNSSAVTRSLESYTTQFKFNECWYQNACKAKIYEFVEKCGRVIFHFMRIVLWPKILERPYVPGPNYFFDDTYPKKIRPKLFTLKEIVFVEFKIYQVFIINKS